MDVPVCLAVGAGPVGLGGEVPETELPAVAGVHRGDVGGAVVGHHLLDIHPSLCEPGDRATQESDGGLAAQHLHVGEAGGVIDADVAALPAVAAAGVAPADL